MVFTEDHFYEITYKDAPAVTFRVMDNNSAFHRKRAFNENIGKEIFLYKLLIKDWERLEEIHIPKTIVSIEIMHDDHQTHDVSTIG